ncbi:MAG: DinB family protein [Gemmatimonadota bacterium]
MATSEVERIRRQLRNAFEGGAWHGPAVWEILGDVTAEEAAGRPLADAHSVWEIVLHVATWLDAVRRRLGGEAYVPSEAENWPSVPEETSDAAWAGARDRLSAAYEALRQALEDVGDADLDRPVAGQAYDVYFMLHGVVQHTLYHAGQLMILKKAVRSPAGT